jgi:hypothetical protein
LHQQGVVYEGIKEEIIQLKTDSDNPSYKSFDPKNDLSQSSDDDETSEGAGSGGFGGGFKK